MLQAIPAGVLLILPVPLPERVTVKRCELGADILFMGIVTKKPSGVAADGIIENDAAGDGAAAVMSKLI